MTLLEQWFEGFSCLEPNSLVFVAFPGVGNVGKCAIEEILAMNLNEEVLRLHPLGLPPLAELDDRGLLSPPHIKVHRVHLSGSQSLYTILGPSQPNQAIEQSMLARQILEFAKIQNIERICVFAGLMDEPERRETFAVATTVTSRQRLVEQGVDVRTDEPRSGAIGVSALITSLGPVYNLDTCCVISSTIGTSKDTMSALRLLRAMNSWFDLQLTLPSEEMLNLRLRSKLSDVDTQQNDFIKEMTSHDTSYM